MPSANDATRDAPSAAHVEPAAASERVRIGLFDSGVGGLSVWRAMRAQLPFSDLFYVADQAHCPYGPRPAAEIRALSTQIVEFLIAQSCDVIVVACNTASAAALAHLRAAFPALAIVGMEPAVKPAARATRSRRVAVLATRGTLEGELFQQTRAAYASGVEVITVYPADWVARVERGEIDSAETRARVREVIAPLLAQGVDAIALGCTHYPFLAPLMEELVDGRAAILDPSAAVALQTARIIGERGENPVPARAAFYTTGEPDEFRRALEKLLGIKEVPVARVALGKP